MKQPDRFERATRQLFYGNAQNGLPLEWIDSILYMNPQYVLKLLRREHQAVVRKVRAVKQFYTQHHAKWLENAGNRPLVQGFKAKADACDDLLAWLEARSK